MNTLLQEITDQIKNIFKTNNINLSQIRQVVKFLDSTLSERELQTMFEDCKKEYGEITWDEFFKRVEHPNCCFNENRLAKS